MDKLMRKNVPRNEEDEAHHERTEGKLTAMRIGIARDKETYAIVQIVDYLNENGKRRFKESGVRVY